MSDLYGVPVHFCQWAEGVKFVKGLGVIIAKDRAAIDAVLEFANSPFYRERELLGDRCVSELLSLYEKWKTP